MSIGTILLIAGALAIMLLMHRVGHAGHASSHGVDGEPAGDGEEGQARDDPRQKKHGCC